MAQRFDPQGKSKAACPTTVLTLEDAHPQVREIEALLNRLEVTYKWARSLGDAARAGALEAVNGQWEALPVYLNTEPHHQHRDLTAKLERRSSHSAAMAEASC